jgi:hypothetical protein
MIKLKRTYSEFKTTVDAKSLDIFYGDIRSDLYHILALDESIIYECFIPKDGGADQLDFETNYLSKIGVSKSKEPDWDDFITSFPSATTELHTYKKNDIVVLTVLVTYSNSSRNSIVRIQKTRP